MRPRALICVSESNIHSFNRYAYANNNPYRFIDPDGQQSREAAFKQLGLQDPSAGVANRARQIADGASAFGDAVESAATDPTNFIPGGIFAGILKKIGGKLVTKGVAKFSRAPKSIQDQMTLKAAQEGQGNVIIKSLNDPKFKGMEKMQLKVKSANGKDSVVNFVRDPKTGNIMDFKFKKHSTDSQN